MTSRLNPYLNFRGRAREAMTFYQEVFGGELTLATFGEFGAQDSPNADKIMHANLHSELDFTLMGADTLDETAPTPGDDLMTVSLTGDDADALRGYFDKLADGGTVTAPLEKQVWGDEFGTCVDRFGIPWMVNVSG